MWDANETWLLIAAATTYGAFPLVYSIGFNALYIPTMVFGVGLVVRVVSYEFYYHSQQRIWSFLFGVGSLLAVIGQGLLFGGYISGITIIDHHFAGGPFDWATPLTALLTVGILFGYLVLGYASLIRFANYELRPHAFQRLVATAGIAIAAMVASTFTLPKTDYLFFTRWTTPPTSYALFAIAGAILAICAVLAYLVLKQKFVEYVYYLCVLVFGLGFLGMIVGVYPFIIPPSITLYEAASSHNTQVFMLWGVAPILPIVLVYNFYIHRLFSRDTEGKLY
jgi:cytochrome d ubiquinol oxidase subunit II